VAREGMNPPLEPAQRGHALGRVAGGVARLKRSVRLPCQLDLSGLARRQDGGRSAREDHA